MGTFNLILDLDKRLDIHVAVQMIQKLFPLTIVEGDTFERKRRQLAENIATLSNEGTPIRNPDLFRQELARNEAESGPGMDVSISFGEAIVITGSIMSGGIRLTAHGQIDTDTVKTIEEYLLSLKIGRVAIGTNQRIA